MTQSFPIHVVVGVIYNTQGDLLLSRRPDHLHQGGLWEFPGGKCEPNETIEQALARELAEELGLVVQQARPLIRVHHAYPKQQVLLDVWQVEKWHGTPWGREQQLWTWCPADELKNQPFPAANYPIITAVQLPSWYLITPEPRSSNDKKFFYQLERSLDTPLTLLQLRAKSLAEKEYCYCAEKVLTLSHRYAAQVLVNATPEIARSVGAHGVHLTSERLMSYSERPLTDKLWVAASAHTFEEVQQANLISTDFIVLSPVKMTASHPDATSLGWQQFFQLTELANGPVFALGGMNRQQVSIAWAHGGQGIAGIRGLWKEW